MTATIRPARTVEVYHGPHGDSSAMDVEVSTMAMSASSVPRSMLHLFHLASGVALIASCRSMRRADLRFTLLMTEHLDHPTTVVVEAKSSLAF